MKVINSKLAAIGLAAFVFASCSDSTTEGGSTNPTISPAEITTDNLVFDSNFAGRVANYKNSTANARKYFFSRAGQAAFPTAFPAYQAEPENAKQLNNPADLTNGFYKIASNKTVNFAGKSINNATIYVHGNCTMQYDALGSGNTIVLYAGAKLEYKGKGEMVPAGNTVLCQLGSEAISDNDIVIAGGFYAEWRGEGANKTIMNGLGKATTVKDANGNDYVKPSQKITFKEGALAYIIGSLRATDLNIEDGASINITNHILNATNVEIDGALQFGGFLRTENMTVKGELVASEHSSIKASNVLNVENGASITADYVNVTNTNKNATLNLKGTGKITINNKSVINTNNLVTDNAASGQITLEDNDAIAVIKADMFTNNGAERINTLATKGDNATFLLQFTKSQLGDKEYKYFEDLDISASYLDYDKATDGKGVAVKETENGADYKSYGYEWVGDPTTIVNTPKLDLVAAEDPKTDGQSATCIAINPNNNKVYVSYHTNGDDVSSGNVEVVHMDGKTFSVDQTVITESFNVDYNQILLDGDKLWVVGNQRGNKTTGVKGVGAFLGNFDLNNDGLYQGKLTMHPINKLESGIDANCVAKWGDEYVVATTKGFTIFDKDMNFWNKNGAEGKYAVTANNNLYALDLTNNGQMNIYSNGDADLANITAAYSTGAIVPAKGKAVVAVDGNNIYVCKGENGLARIDATTGNITQVFNCPTFKVSNTDKANYGETEVKGNCNGVAVDDQHIYIACGGYGLVVLDKATGNVLCHRKAYNGKSANYVAVDSNKNIYVAYGQSRIQVFKLTSTK